MLGILVRDSAKSHVGNCLAHENFQPQSEKLGRRSLPRDAFGAENSTKIVGTRRKRAAERGMGNGEVRKAAVSEIRQLSAVQSQWKCWVCGKCTLKLYYCL